MKRLVLLVLAVSCCGCALLDVFPGGPPGLPTPAPTPTPTPTPDPHVPVCAPPSLVTLCWHQPPEGWRWNCAAGQAVEKPSDCPPFPDTCVIPDGPTAHPVEPRWPSDQRPPLDPKVAELVNKAWKVLRPDCEVGGRCVLGKETPVHEHLAALVKEIRVLGGCAGVQVTADELCVLIEPGRCQGVHAVVPAGQWTVGWAVPGAHRDTWVTGAPPPPPVEVVCTEPTPDATFFKLHASWNTANTVAWVDATGRAKNKEWCSEHYGPEGPWPNPNNLLTCPTRPEGHPERKACDKVHGTPTWFVNGQRTPSDEGDPFHVHVPKGSRVQACRATADGFDPGACSGEMTVTP